MKRIKNPSRDSSGRTSTVVGRHQGKVRVGIVGAGVFGGYHAQKFAASEHAEFIGVFDLNAEAAGKVVAKVGQGAVFTSFEALADVCDAMVIATPASSHATLTRKALEAGKHALVEKPLALTGVEARALAKLALERDLVLSVGHQERLVFEAMGLFATGERPKRIEAVRNGPASPEGRCEDVSVVFDLMIHDLDLTAELFGGEVKGADGAGYFAHTRLLDHVTAELHFANNGHAKLTASRCAEKRERWMKIEYASGVVEIDFITREVKNTTTFDIRADVSATLPDPLKAADEAFIAAVQGRAAPVITGGVGARAAAMAELVEGCALAEQSVAAA